jgi:hypothetical protein
MWTKQLGSGSAHEEHCLLEYNVMQFTDVSVERAVSVFWVGEYTKQPSFVYYFLLVEFLASSSALKMEAAYFSETSATLYRRTHIPQDSALQLCRCYSFCNYEK